MVSEYTEEVWSPRRESNPTFVPRRCVPLELHSSLPQRASDVDIQIAWSQFDAYILIALSGQAHICAQEV